MQLRAEEVDALAACDLGVELVLLGHRADGDQAVGRDLAGGNARHHRIRAVLLHVCHEGVVGVLQRHQVRVLDGVVPARCQDGADRRLADVATYVPHAMAGQQGLERFDDAHAHDGVQLLAGVGEMLTQAFVHGDAAAGQFVFHHLLEQAGAAAAARGRFRAAFDAGQIGAAAVDGGADRAFADVVTGAEGGSRRQRIHAQRGRGLAQRQDQAGGIGRRRDAVLHILQQGVVIAVVADQHRAQDALAVGRHYQPAVAGPGLIDVAVAARTRRRAVRVADGPDVHPQQFQLGRHVGARERFPNTLPFQAAHSPMA
ncbi:hypothetical protein G6F22_014666 [Rhizopus arrhizus]|nr:hypothetical protein G6F22_014666 [Rhizopus arrhizus]